MRVCHNCNVATYIGLRPRNLNKLFKKLNKNLICSNFNTKFVLISRPKGGYKSSRSIMTTLLAVFLQSLMMPVLS